MFFNRQPVNQNKQKNPDENEKAEDLKTETMMVNIGI